MNLQWSLLLLIFSYLGLLIGIAYWGEKRSQQGRSLINNPYVYSLSLAVFCTAWTYYGSVGQASEDGILFLTTYLGPTLTAPLWWIWLRKLIRISKVQRLNTPADFISSRYGKNIGIGRLVTALYVLGVLPYISIQIKAISNSANIMLGQSQQQGAYYFSQDTALYVTLGLAIFTILFGTRKVDANQRHEGLVTAIAFESVFKLLAFLALGLFVTYGVFDGLDDIFDRALLEKDTQNLFLLDTQGGYAGWFWMILLSSLAVILLPRQFQVAVKENVQEDHIKKAIWLFPLYLLAINIFVYPIALGGSLIFSGQEVDADTYVLAIPLFYNQEALAMLTFLGGFSASTGMIIVSTIALSTMISNTLLTPWLINRSYFQRMLHTDVSSLLLFSRRLIIVILLLLAYLFFRFVSDRLSLVSVGLVSFVAVAQFAPALIGGMYWKGATRSGAVASISIGFLVWVYTLLLPTMVETGFVGGSILTEGPFGVIALRPYPFLGLDQLDTFSHSIFWSLLLSSLSLILVSLYSRQSSQERNQAEVFVDIFKYSTIVESSIVWKGTAYVSEIKQLLSKFLGRPSVEAAFREFGKRHSINWKEMEEADYRIVNFAEKLLSGAIGTASARVMLASVVKEEDITYDDVFYILQESRELISANKSLKKKSRELQEATAKLRITNAKLKKLDHLKDEFISTVTHEMRTPITSIRAFSEILYDNHELEPEERSHFLETIIKETGRMERLINQVLDLERFESGKQKLELNEVNINDVIYDAIDTLTQVVKEKQIILQADLQKEMPSVMADADRLMQVMLNLLSNAIKFCDPQEGRITISSYYLDGDIKVNVMDNGKGVPVEDIPLIFEGFFQASNQNFKKPKGSGLGLTICKKIIEHHQGEIWLESESGKGAKFSFTLPLPQRKAVKITY